MNVDTGPRDLEDGTWGGGGAAGRVRMSSTIVWCELVGYFGLREIERPSGVAGAQETFEQLLV